VLRSQKAPASESGRYIGVTNASNLAERQALPAVARRRSC
jgi:hypothetical protein